MHTCAITIPNTGGMLVGGVFWTSLGASDPLGSPQRADFFEKKIGSHYTYKSPLRFYYCICKWTLLE